MEPLLALGAFLCGSIPFGLLIGKSKGVDIRQHGSGNIGASNVGRVLGKKFFFICFALDFLKGFTPTLLGGLALGAFSRSLDSNTAWWWLTIMVASVLGHVFSPWLKFKGGKGVATALGAMLAVFPHLTVPALGSFLVWLLTLAITRYISVSSIAAGLLLPLFVVGWALAGPALTGGDRADPRASWPFLVVAAALAALVVWTHRGNIQRLRQGTENKLGAKPAPARS